MSLRKAVTDDCMKLLHPDYKWITYRNHGGEYPPFKMPKDPKWDIVRVMNWTHIVEKESKGQDSGDNRAAADMRDEGQKVYQTNQNILNAVSERNPGFIAPEQRELALERWQDLLIACNQCRKLMQLLHYNE